MARFIDLFVAIQNPDKVGHGWNVSALIKTKQFSKPTNLNQSEMEHLLLTTQSRY